MAVFSNLSNYRNFGLFIIRIGLGIMFIMHGYPKLSGGEPMWGMVGASTKAVGITFWPVFWGFMSAIVETFGGLMLIIGFLFRPVCLLLIANLLVAASFHLHNGQGWMGASHAIEDAVTFTGLFFIGPGKYSVDKK